MAPGLTVIAGVAILGAAAAIVGEERGHRPTVYVAKPLTTLLILVAVAGMTGADPRYRALVVAGLAASLAGDVFLMLPRDRFLPGLVSFLIAHLAYLAAFVAAPAGRSTWIAAAALLVLGLGLLRILWPGLGRFRGPVIGYMGAILAMAWMAANRWLVAPAPGTAAAVLGALLFVVSDSLLAVDRFRGRFRWSRASVLATYWAAQALIGWSVRGSA